ncbi:MAG: hypothetical protein NT023_00960, partial [Armatimonadetes bacterium]|nr:hypothetical protein [Armatimonadota bacterium]
PEMRMLYLNHKPKKTPLLSIQGDMDTNIHCSAIMANYDAFALSWFANLLDKRAIKHYNKHAF